MAGRTAHGRRRGDTRRWAAAAVLLAAAAVLAFLLLRGPDPGPTLDFGQLRERGLRWRDLTACAMDGVPLPIPTDACAGAIDLPGAHVLGPCQVPEWPAAALYRVSTPDAVHIVLVVPRQRQHEHNPAAAPPLRLERRELRDHVLWEAVQRTERSILPALR